MAESRLQKKSIAYFSHYEAGLTGIGIGPGDRVHLKTFELNDKGEATALAAMQTNGNFKATRKVAKPVAEKKA
ncbi:hypothetical protein GCM10023187_31390 [Nibrella viscosa]|uniref:Uncharacterized protein n=1 Tax=Nibrella viscosa TaxID=1084524 RepID=A0ABP8KJT9_9BACT